MWLKKKRELIPVDPVEPLDADRSAAAAAEGLARSMVGRDELGHLYDQAVAKAAQRHPVLTIDEVWSVLGWMPRGKGPKSAIGGAMTRAQEAGILQPTGRSQPSKRPAAHKKLNPVYNSMLFDACRTD